jgi:hypothetical protein
VTVADQFLTTAEAAAQLGMKPRTLAAWRARGIGPAYVRAGGRPGGAIRYPASAVQAYLTKQTVPEGRQPNPLLFPMRRWWEMEP